VRRPSGEFRRNPPLGSLAMSKPQNESTSLGRPVSPGPWSSLSLPGVARVRIM
jgi:hypothetical protein